jgi:hypothetical protein
MAIQIVAEPVIRVSTEIDMIKSITKATTITIKLNDRFKHFAYIHDGTVDYNTQFPQLVKLFQNRFIPELSDEKTITVFFDSVSKTLNDAGSANGYTVNC